MGAKRLPETDGLLREFGARVREIRQEQGLTQVELAEISGLHRVTVAKIETGQLDVQLSTVHRLAGGMGLPVSELLRS